MARNLKPVSFNPETSKSDREILEYIEELGVSFGSYVKYLIQKDMKAVSTIQYDTNDTKEIAKQLGELVNVLKNKSVSIGAYETKAETNEADIETVEIDDTEAETEAEKAQRLAMERFLNGGN